jgi:hypothetical protein
MVTFGQSTAVMNQLAPLVKQTVATRRKRFYNRRGIAGQAMI